MRALLDDHFGKDDLCPKLEYGDGAVGGGSMLKRGSKSSYNPYSTSQRVKKGESKGKDRLDILPNKHNVWLKQVGWCATDGKRKGMFFCVIFVKYLDSLVFVIRAP